MSLRITALAGGVGGARFLRGLLAAVPDAQITVIGNTGDDITLFGLRVCPDLDTVMYTLGNGINAEQGWGREGETFAVKEELAVYGAQPQWFGLGDKDFATHIVRTKLIADGQPLHLITEALCARWKPGVKLIPMSNDRVETHVVVEREAGRVALHFQEWWVRLHAAEPAVEFRSVGAATASPAPGVLEAIAQADVVVLPPSNPVVSIGSILQVPGIRDALRRTAAPVVGISPIIGAAPVRGMADACLAALGVETSAQGVGAHYGARQVDGQAADGILDGWLVAPGDAFSVDGVASREVPLLMTDVPTTAQLARDLLALAEQVRR